MSRQQLTPEQQRLLAGPLTDAGFTTADAAALLNKAGISTLGQLMQLDYPTAANIISSDEIKRVLRSVGLLHPPGTTFVKAA